MYVIYVSWPCVRYRREENKLLGNVRNRNIQCFKHRYCNCHERRPLGKVILHVMPVRTYVTGSTETILFSSSTFSTL